MRIYEKVALRRQLSGVHNPKFKFPTVISTTRRLEDRVEPRFLDVKTLTSPLPSLRNTMFSSTAAVRTKDVELSQPPPESVSKIAFSPTQDILAVASWDNNVSRAQASTL